MKLRLRNTFLIPLLIITTLGIALPVFVFQMNSKQSLMDLTNNHMAQSVDLTSKLLGMWIENNMVYIGDLAKNKEVVETVYDDNGRNLKPQREPSILFKDICSSKIWYSDILLADKTGKVVSASDELRIKEDLTVYDYYEKTRHEIPYVSDSFPRKKDNQLIFVIACPILMNGEFKGMVVGEIYMEYLQKHFILPVKPDNKGYIFLYNRNTGSPVAYPHKSIILNIEEGDYHLFSTLADKGATSIKHIHKGVELIVATSPVLLSPWNLAFCLPFSEIVAPAKKSFNFGVMVVLLFTTLVACIIWFLTGRYVLKPVKSVVEFAMRLSSEGDSAPILPAGSSSEFDELGAFLNAFAHELNGKADVAVKIAQGDFRSKVNVVSEKDRLGMALESTLTGLNTTARIMWSSAKKVTISANRVFGYSRLLARDAADQEGVLGKIRGDIAELETLAGDNLKNVSSAKELFKDAMDATDRGADQMMNMMIGMDAINESSDSIAKIIKTIDGIAFQTNLLALNASVEAARAGKHGKGFAVVAQEVRGLASRTANAAQETAELIENSSRKVADGSENAVRTASVLEEIVKFVNKVNDIVAEIESMCIEQSRGFNRINKSLKKIENITSQNVGTANESFAAGETLLKQAMDVEHIVQKYKLKKSIENQLEYKGLKDKKPG